MFRLRPENYKKDPFAPSDANAKRCADYSGLRAMADLGMRRTSMLKVTRGHTFILVILSILVFVIRSRADAATTGITAISITRTGCLGVCPDYTLTIRKSGCAHLDGNFNFALIGHFSAFLVDFDQAVGAVNSHHFFDFKGEYPMLKDGEVILDAPTATLTVVRDGFDYKVLTYPSHDMPASLQELFSIIDGIGFTAYWFNDDTKEPVASKHFGGKISIDKGAFKPCV